MNFVIYRDGSKFLRATSPIVYLSIIPDSSYQQEMDWLDCPACRLHFDEKTVKPLLLSPCQHLMCSTCYSNITPKRCSLCRKPISKTKTPYHLRHIAAAQGERLEVRRQRNQRRNQKRRQNEKVKVKKMEKELEFLRQRTQELNAFKVAALAKEATKQSHPASIPQLKPIFSGKGRKIGDDTNN